MLDRTEQRTVNGWRVCRLNVRLLRILASQFSLSNWYILRSKLWMIEPDREEKARHKDLKQGIGPV